jgi:hypothetical protein
MECGAVYSKVEATMRGDVPPRPRDFANSRGSSSRLSSSRRSGVNVHIFAERMRDESLYPTWRKLVNLAAVFVYAIAAIAFLVALIALFKGAMAAGGTGMCVALLIAVFARVSKEASHMLADLSDASVRLAARADSDS